MPRDAGLLSLTIPTPSYAVPMAMNNAELMDWASEHLYYEATTLEQATQEIKKGPQGPMESVLLQSFVLNARCLNDFLWHDRSQKHPDDMFATDFCKSGEWEATRALLPQIALQALRKRSGREVMHLTRKRISGYGKKKEWHCGLVFGEIATALTAFAGLARVGTLDAKTHTYLAGLPETVFGLGVASGATGITAGTAVFDPAIVAGGKR